MSNCVEIEFLINFPQNKFEIYPFLYMLLSFKANFGPIVEYTTIFLIYKLREFINLLPI